LTIASTSSSGAVRLATNRLSDVMWLGLREVENPIAPAPTASRTAFFIAVISASVGSSEKARSPIT
jgi:hypothetical protein